jgi:uncharacterized membrane protein (DUF485 family)
MITILKTVLTILLVVAMIFTFSLLIGFPVKWLVNGLFTDQVRLALFGVARIGFWRAVGLSFLCGILFKSSGSTSSSSSS